VVLKIPRKDNIKMEILVYQIPVKVHSLFISNCQVCQIILPGCRPKCIKIALHEIGQMKQLIRLATLQVAYIHKFNQNYSYQLQEFI
jgi:hypothetical protein